MSTEVVVFPKYMENIESRGIISTDVMNINSEVTNDTKTFISQPASSVNSTGASFQCINVSKFIDTNIRMDETYVFTITGHTYGPTPGVAAVAPAPPAPGVPAMPGYLTPPFLWSPDNCTLDCLSQNKKISKITFSMQNKSWTETDRYIEMFDIMASQFDQKKMESYGLFPFENQGSWKLGDIYGSGKQTRPNFMACNIFPQLVGISNNIQDDSENVCTKAYKYGYFTASSTFSTEGIGGAGPLITQQWESFGNADIPTLGGAVYYTNGAVGHRLIQTVTIKCSEFIISPSLSNPYCKNPYSKTIFLGNYPFNMQFDYNQQYLNAMFKNLLPYVGNSTAPDFNNSAPIVSNITITNSTLNFYTFDTAKRISSSPYQRTLYNYLAKQNVNDITGTIGADGTLNGPQLISCTTSNLSSLPSFIIGYVSLNTLTNNDFVKATNATNTTTPNNVQTLATYMLNPLDQLTISYGSQSDVMCGSTSMTWKEVTDMTIECLGNPQYRNLIFGNHSIKEAYNAFDPSEAGALNAAIGVPGVPPASLPMPTAGLDTGFFWRAWYKRQGMPFFLINCSRLNFRPILNDLPTIPLHNYGSNNFKSLSIKFNCNLATIHNHVINGTTTKINLTPYIFLVTSRIRSLPMDGESLLNDQLVEFDIINRKADLMELFTSFKISNNGANNVNDEIQFVGGAWFGDIMNKVKSILPSVKSAAKLVHDATQGREGLLGDINRISGLAHSGLTQMGYGKKLGRPRKY